MFDLIARFFNDNRPVRNKFLQLALKRADAFAVYSKILEENVDSSVVQIIDNETILYNKYLGHKIVVLGGMTTVAECLFKYPLDCIVAHPNAVGTYVTNNVFTADK